MPRIKIGRVMCHSPEIVGQYRREKEARIWLWDLMHYIHDTGKYASRKRDMLRKYHADQDYIGEVGIDEKGNPFCRYHLLPMQMNKHKVVLVDHFVEVKEGEFLKIPSDFFHCLKCKLMGTKNTMQEYTCS